MMSSAPLNRTATTATVVEAVIPNTDGNVIFVQITPRLQGFCKNSDNSA
jgi:hypothetical protein